MATPISVTTLFVKRGILKLLGRRFDRTEEKVKYEYDGIWAKPAEWDKDRSAFRAEQIRLLAGAINTHNPKRVLELGAGMGAVLDDLVPLCPNVEHFEGLELTERGVTALTHDPKITMTQGSMLELPYADNSFDMVFSMDAFEQIPRDWKKGFEEAYRVTKKHAVFIEPFGNAQRTIFARMHLANVDYFRESSDRLKEIGFDVTFMPLSVSKPNHTDGIAICVKPTR